MDIQKAPTIELKAAAYDRLAQQEQLQREIQAINAELSRRAQTTEQAEEAAIEDKIIEETGGDTEETPS